MAGSIGEENRAIGTAIEILSQDNRHRTSTRPLTLNFIDKIPQGCIPCLCFGGVAHVVRRVES